MDDALSYLRANSIDALHHTVEIPRLSPRAPLPQPVINGTGFPPQLFALSSQDQDGIARLCRAYREYLPTMTEPLYNLSYTLAEKRSRLDWRAFVVASSSAELEAALKQELLATRTASEPGLGLVFTGQGAQWPRMGAGLARFDVYRESLEAANAYLKTIGCEWSVVGAWFSTWFLCAFTRHQLTWTKLQMNSPSPPGTPISTRRSSLRLSARFCRWPLLTFSMNGVCSSVPLWATPRARPPLPMRPVRFRKNPLGVLLSGVVSSSSSSRSSSSSNACLFRSFKSTATIYSPRGICRKTVGKTVRRSRAAKGHDGRRGPDGG